MMGGDMGWMMGGMMAAGVLITLLVVALLIVGLVALMRAIMSEKPSMAPASITLITVAIVGGLAVVALLAAAGMCGGMFLGGSA
jgi:hypothetical protein